MVLKVCHHTNHRISHRINRPINRRIHRHARQIRARMAVNARHREARTHACARQDTRVKRATPTFQP